MSFGFSIGDIVALLALTKRTYDGWRNAPTEYADVVQTLSECKILLSHVERRFDTLIGTETSAEKQKEIGELLRGCKKTISELRTVIKRRRNLGHWDRFRLGAAASNVNESRNRLARHINMLTPFLFSLELESIGKDVSSLPATLDRLPQMVSNALPAALGKMIDQRIEESRTVRGSVMTTYGDDDDKQAYKELRRNLRSLGIKDSMVREQRTKLVEFIRSLTCDDHNAVSNDTDRDRQSSGQQPVLSPSPTPVGQIAEDTKTACAKNASTTSYIQHPVSARSQDGDEYMKSVVAAPSNDSTATRPEREKRNLQDPKHRTRIGDGIENGTLNKPEAKEKAGSTGSCRDSTAGDAPRPKHQTDVETKEHEVDTPKTTPRTRKRRAAPPPAPSPPPPPYPTIGYEPLDVAKEGFLTIQLHDIHVPDGFSIDIEGGRTAQFFDRCAPSRTWRQCVPSLPHREYHLLPNCLHGFPSAPPLPDSKCDCQVVYWTPELQRCNPGFMDGLRRWSLEEGVASGDGVRV